MSIPENPAVEVAADQFETPPGADFSTFLAREAARNRRETELMPLNKAALFAALSAARVGRVVVLFDGSGDSGQIESIDATAGDEPVSLPNVDVEIIRPTWGASEPERQQSPIRDESSSWPTISSPRPTGAGKTTTARSGSLFST